MRIGIVIPAYNADAWIADAIYSVLMQPHQDWRLVVVDDGSTDATSGIVACFTDPRITLIWQPNAGVSAARNRGAAEFLGALPVLKGDGGSGGILFLDADDQLGPDALSRLAAALDRSPAAIAAVGAYTLAHTRYRRPPSGELLPRILIRNLFANGGHVLIRAEALNTAGPFRTGIAYGEDWEFWIRLALLGPFAAITGTAPVLHVRQNDGGAYHRLAADPASFAPCMDAIFSNPALLARFGSARLAAIRRRTEAENAWIIGRELIRHGRASEGRAWLRRSVRGAPSFKRVALLAASLFPIGPFVPYAVAGRASFACSDPTSPCGRKMMNTTSNVP